MLLITSINSSGLRAPLLPSPPDMSGVRCEPMQRRGPSQGEVAGAVQHDFVGVPTTLDVIGGQPADDRAVVFLVLAADGTSRVKVSTKTITVSPRSGT